MRYGVLRRGVAGVAGALLLGVGLAWGQAGAGANPTTSPGDSGAAPALAGGEKRHLYGGQFDPRAPEATPAAIRPEWAKLIGEYEADQEKFYVLEDEGKLMFLMGKDDFETFEPKGADVFELPGSEPQASQTVTFQRDAAQSVTGVAMGGVVYKRRPFDGPGDFFHITPLRPVEVLRKEALADKPPVETGSFRKPDLVQLNVLDPTIKLDIRYATSRNFLTSPMYTEARAYMQRPAAQAVVRASQKLHALGYGLIIHDSYRPWYVTKMFWDGTPVGDHGFVANPAKGSKHNRGCAVDLSLYSLKTGEEIRMTGGYDEMSERSYPFYPGGTARERWHRDLLRHAMEAEGFTVNESEWWHFDYKDWAQYPILNLTFEEMEKTGVRE